MFRSLCALHSLFWSQSLNESVSCPQVEEGDTIYKKVINDDGELEDWPFVAVRKNGVIQLLQIGRTRASNKPSRPCSSCLTAAKSGDEGCFRMKKKQHDSPFPLANA